MSLTAPQSQETALVGRIVQSNVETDTLTIKAQFEDRKTGEARTPQSSTRVFTLSKDTERFEMILADSHVTAAGVTTITVNAAGRNLNKYGNMVGAATGNRHPINSEIGCADTHIPVEILNEIIRGNEGTNANNFRVGNETNNDITFYAQNGDANKPFFRYDASENAWVFSNNGVDTSPMGGDNVYTAGDGLSLAAGDFDIDTSDNVIFVSGSAGPGDQNKVPILNASGLLDDTFFPIALSTITATPAEINQALDGISANVTDTNLNTLTGGGDASALHSHSASTRSFTALEAVSAGEALALIPNEVQHYTQLTDANLALGDANARRRYAIKIVPTVTSNTLTTMQFRGKEINGGSTLNLTISIQGDNAGEPDGAAIANGTANNIAVSGWGTSYANRTATWAASPTLTAGTTYWIVFSVDATEAAEGIHLSVNSSHDENYNTFTRLTYDLDTATWGNSATNAAPFFWFNTQEDLLGVGVVPTDANHPNRTWNFIGFAQANAAANASVGVYTDFAPNLTGLNRRRNYYISTTAGEITTSKPDQRYNGTSTVASYKVGRAMEDGTTLKIELGEKMIWHAETGTATTATNIITWFNLDHLDIWGGMGSTATLQQGMGIYDRTNSYCAFTISDDGGAESAALDQNNTLSDGGSFGNRYDGTVSNVNEVGFTHTMTETGTSSYSYMMRIYG